MRRRLIDLLAERVIAHPSRILRATVERGDLRLEVEGWRWWDGTDGADGRLELVFAGLLGGALDATLLGLSSDDEDLDVLMVSPLAEEPWALTGRIHSLYCQGPLPDPLAVHAVVHDLLVGRRAPRSPFDYLNGGSTLDRFRWLTSRGNFLLSRAPPDLHVLIADEVARQAVPHSELVADYPATTDLFVRLGDASFICTDAWAEWDEDGC